MVLFFADVSLNSLNKDLEGDFIDKSKMTLEIGLFTLNTTKSVEFRLILFYGIYQRGKIASARLSITLINYFAPSSLGYMCKSSIILILW